MFWVSVSWNIRKAFSWENIRNFLGNSVSWSIINFSRGGFFYYLNLGWKVEGWGDEDRGTGLRSALGSTKNHYFFSFFLTFFFHVYCYFSRITILLEGSLVQVYYVFSNQWWVIDNAEAWRSQTKKFLPKTKF